MANRPVQPPSDIYHDSQVVHEVVVSEGRTGKVKKLRSELRKFRGLWESIHEKIISVHKIKGTKNEANGLTKTSAGPLDLSQSIHHTQGKSAEEKEYRLVVYNKYAKHKEQNPFVEDTIVTTANLVPQPAYANASTVTFMPWLASARPFTSRMLHVAAFCRRSIMTNVIKQLVHPSNNDYQTTRSFPCTHTPTDAWKRQIMVVCVIFGSFGSFSLLFANCGHSFDH